MFSQQFPGYDSFTGRIVGIEVVDGERVFKVAHDDGDNEEEVDVEETLGLLGRDY